MALFGLKKNKKTDAPSDSKDLKKNSTEDKKVEKNFGNKTFSGLDVTKIIKKPRVSEKAAIVGESSNAYIFDVHQKANKNQIKLAIEKIYKVTPIKINICQIKPKKVRVRGTNKKTGTKSGGKKAFVFLKKGEKIEII